jgi:hypothetical protein
VSYLARLGASCALVLVVASATPSCAGEGEGRPESLLPIADPPTVAESGASPIERCHRVCDGESLYYCGPTPRTAELCEQARCGNELPCASLDALLACTVYFPNFVCGEDGAPRLSPYYERCQPLYEAYVAEARACSGTQGP